MAAIVKRADILTKLERLDLRWDKLGENYNHINLMQIICFAPTREALAPDYKVLSAAGEYCGNREKGEERDSSLANAVGFTDYPSNSYDKFAFIKQASSGSLEGALILKIPDVSLGQKNYSTCIVRNFHSSDAANVLKKYVSIKEKAIDHMRDALKKYLGKENLRDPGMHTDLASEEIIKLDLKDKSGFDRELWSMLGSLDSKFLDRTRISFGDYRISFGGWEDCNGGDSPSYAISYVLENGASSAELKTGGDCATAQGVILDIYKNAGITLPEEAKADELE